jgi:IS30 family transposase
LDDKASTAQWHAERRARRPKTAKLITNARLRDYVNDKLSGHVKSVGGERLGPVGPVWDGKNTPRREDRAWVTPWSPQQIAKRLPVASPDDSPMRISHEAIYQALYVPALSVTVEN